MLRVVAASLLFIWFGCRSHRPLPVAFELDCNPFERSIGVDIQSRYHSFECQMTQRRRARSKRKHRDHFDRAKR